MTTLYTSTIDSPVGPLRIVASALGIRAVLWPSDRAERVPLDDVEPVGDEETAEAGDRAPESGGADSAQQVLAAAARQLTEYFAGERLDFDLPLDPAGTDFQHSAWTALRTIPYGSTVSYGEQAERMGDKRKARAVGAANGRNPISIIVPCHRVVGANGSLTGFAGGIETKRWLLDHERRVVGHTLDL